MLKKIIPVLFLLIGIGVGVGAGIFLGAGKTEHSDEQTQHVPTDSHNTPVDEPEYVKLSNQFVVPVVSGEQVSALVVLTLSLETVPGMTETIYSREPKLRDAFLQVMFDHANMGGFDGSFTSSNTLDILRTALREVAQLEFGNDISNVLIVGIARQDV
ncbi:MAG: flagellar basal body-associated protein FliL [Rhodobacteraceae bacterium]|nr:flagellar basal body-associated protein FliL [Paracoccaceae bacterium]